MITIREAVTKAMAYAQEVLGEDRTRGLRLEEVDSADLEGGPAWLITLSMIVAGDDDPNGPLGDIAPLLFKNKRQYKTVAVRKETGEFVSMRIRDLANV